jgi:cyclophilin family peptidyl-prolyl cis-trans isomerase
MQEENKTEKMPMSSYIALGAAIIIIIIGYIWWSSNKKNEVIGGPDGAASVQQATSQNLMHNVTIQTNKGNIIFQTFDKDAPIAVKNFIDLTNKGFYNGVIFHRVIKDFMIQGGDPTGTGRGGPGYVFEDELDPTTESYKLGYTRGIVAMANAGPNTNGSQFFIMHADYALPHNYTIFGRVVSGMEVVDAIANSEVDENDRPIDKVVMNRVTVSVNK